MAEFQSIFPVALEGASDNRASIKCLSVDRNNATTSVRLVVLDDSGGVLSTKDEELRLFQKDFKNPTALRKRLLQNASRLDLASVLPSELFATYPKFKPLERGLTTDKLMKAIRKPAEAGTDGFFGAVRATRWWPAEAKTALGLSRTFAHFEFTSVAEFVEEAEAEELAATRTALSEAGCTDFVAALDAAVAGSGPVDGFNLREALQNDVRPALEAYIGTHASVLLA